MSALAGPLGITLAAVVQHVQTLEECGVIRTEKRGRVRTCRVLPESLVEQWLAARRSQWERYLDRLGTVLDERMMFTEQVAFLDGTPNAENRRHGTAAHLDRITGLL